MNRHGPIARRTFLETGAALAGACFLAAGEKAGAPPKRKEPWRIGCYTRPWGGHDWRVALDAIAEAGFRYAGLMTTRSESRLVISAATPVDEARRVGEEAAARGLEIPSVYGGGIGVGKSPEAGVEDLRRLIDNCAACGSASLLMGGVGAGDLYEPYYKAIAECCGYAAEKKVAITIKPHGGLNATGPECRKAVDLVNHRNFTIWYDPGNILYYSDAKLEPVKDAATVPGLVTGVCVKDYRHPKNVAVTPGTGQVDFPAVMAVLKEGGFTGGPLVIETLAPGDLPSMLAEARKARQFVERLVA
jgi:sugar phosphate isomerase/epimerase